MVLPDSGRISRVPPYSGASLTKFSTCRVRDSHPLRSPFPVAFRYVKSFLLRPGSFNPHNTTVHAYHISWVWALPFSLAATQGISSTAPKGTANSLLISFPQGTKMVQFPWFPLIHLCIQRMITGILNQLGYPIRQSADLRMFAPPHGFSQLTTAFLVPKLLGILRRPFFA